MTARLRIALATAAQLPKLDEDGPALIGALADLGVEARAAVWDDPAERWDQLDAVVIRSTWDYVERHAAFVAWASAVSERTRLANPADVIAWNTDKRYLGELARAGLPVVPTEWAVPGEAAPLPSGPFVVKPTVGAGSRGARRFAGAREHAQALAHVRHLHASGRTVMVQPYQSRVDADGETAVVFAGGRFSHGARKGPMLAAEGELVDGLYVREQITPRAVPPPWVALAERVLAAVPGGADRLLYARVDLVPGPDGQPVLMELELTEPSLFLGCDPAAAGRMAAAIAAWVRG